MSIYVMHVTPTGVVHTIYLLSSLGFKTTAFYTLSFVVICTTAVVEIIFVPFRKFFSFSSYSSSLKVLGLLSTKLKLSEAESDLPAAFHCLSHPYFPHCKTAINPPIKFINKKYLN
jgi:hypothetical protein